MKRKFLSALAIMLLIFSIFSVSSFPIKNEDNLELRDSSNSPSSLIAPSTPNAPRTSSSSGPWLETNSHGGSWLDSFNNCVGIDWYLSDLVNLTNGNVKLIKNPPAPLKVDNNTMALWHCDEGSGSALADSTLYYNNGTLLKNTGWTTGRWGNALNFSGGGQWFNGDVVNVPTSTSLNITGHITMEAWVKAKGTEDYLTIVDKHERDINAGLSYGYSLMISDGKIRISIYGGSNGIGNLYGKTELRDDQWHFVRGVFNGTHLLLYVDCVLDNKKICTVAPAISDYDLGIGLRQDGWGCYGPFYGAIDEVRVSNIARSFTRIANITSKAIQLPTEMRWDTLIINKTQPEYTYLDVKILNGSDNLPIMGSPKYINDGEFDISYIDPVKYPSIKLKAKLVTESCKSSPALHYWGVSWNATNAWRDSLVGGLKGVSNYLNYSDGNIYLKSEAPQKFTITSTSDFDAGKKINIHTLTDNAVIPAGEFQISHNNTILIEPFEGIDEQDLDVYDPNWLLDVIGISTGKIDTGQKRSGTSSLRFYATGPGNKGQATRNVGGYTTITTYVRADGPGSPSLPCSALDEGSFIVRFAFYSNNDIKYYDGPTWTDTGYDYAYNTWYKLKIIIDYNNQNYDVYIDGGSFNNFLIVDDANFQNPTYSSNIVRAGNREGWGSDASYTWYDDLVVEGYQYSGVWESAPQIIMENHQIMNTTISFENLIPEISEIDKIEWLEGGTVKATYDTDLENDLLSPLTLTDADLDSGSFKNITSDFTIKVHLFSNGSMTPRIKDIEGYTIKIFGNLTSEPITVPPNYKWDTLFFNTTEPNNTSLTITIIDNNTNMPIINYTNLNAYSINLSGLDPTTYPSIKLFAEFRSTDGKNEPILHDWSVNWTPIAQPNKPPIADAGLNQTVNENQQVMLNGNTSFDPDGSIANWSWDLDADGVFELYGSIANFTFNDDSINNVTLMVVDDQGANDTDWVVITVLNVNASIENVSVSNAYPRTIGYWKHQCKIDTPKGDHTGILPEFIDGVNANSSVFNTLSTKFEILDYLEPEDHSNMLAKAKQQLLALWLNVVSGKLGLGTPINLTHLTNATTVGAAITEIEVIILSSSSNRSELERAKDIADSINNGIGINSGTTLYLWLSDPGSDDLNLTIDWDDGSGNTTMIFYNNCPINTSDPYPSQFAGKAPVTIFTIIGHNYSSSGIYNVTINVKDDDGGSTLKNIIIKI